jgi:hypothetical protein
MLHQLFAILQTLTPRDHNQHLDQDFRLQRAQSPAGLIPANPRRVRFGDGWVSVDR